MNSSIASANNATLASVATTYALKSVVDQLALDVAARQTAGDVAQAIATALLPMASTSDLTAAVNLRTTPADVSQLIATALLPFVQQAAVDAALALRDARLDGHDTEILALQNAGPFATAGDLNTLQLTLQSAIDGILAEISTLGGATNLVNAPAWLGNVTWDLLAGTNTVRNLHATGPLSIQLANDDWTLSFGCDAYTTQQTDDAIAAALTNYFTRAEVTVTVVAAIDESKGTRTPSWPITATRHRRPRPSPMPWCPTGRRPSGTPPSQQPSRATTRRPKRTPPSRRRWCPTGRWPSGTPPSPMRWRPSKRRPSGTPPSQQPSRATTRRVGRHPRGGPRELLHLGSDGCRHRSGGAAEQRPDLERPNSRTRRRCWPSSPRPWCPTGTKGRCQASWPASSVTTPPAAR